MITYPCCDFSHSISVKWLFCLNRMVPREIASRKITDRRSLVALWHRRWLCIWSLFLGNSRDTGILLRQILNQIRRRYLRWHTHRVSDGDIFPDLSSHTYFTGIRQTQNWGICLILKAHCRLKWGKLTNITKKKQDRRELACTYAYNHAVFKILTLIYVNNTGINVKLTLTFVTSLYPW